MHEALRPLRKACFRPRDCASWWPGFCVSDTRATSWEATMILRFFATRILAGSFSLSGLVLAAAQLGFATNASAQQDQVAAFYSGRTVQAVVGYTPGSTFELYLRMFVRHLARHVPGNPNIVVQHMPGAGSLKATSYLAGI